MLVRRHRIKRSVAYLKWIESFSAKLPGGRGSVNLSGWIDCSEKKPCEWCAETTELGEACLT